MKNNPGLKLKIFRIQKKLRQIDLALQMKVRENRIAFFETNRVRMNQDEIRRAAKILNVKQSDLI